MELREFAEGILFARSLEEKLRAPGEVTDLQPGPARGPLDAPHRPAELRFKPQGARPYDFPGAQSLDHENERGRILHFFANHELLATELMALALLRFPEAPAAFRRGLLQTLKDEQTHTRLYLHRMRECGVAFGELPVSGYFWRAISGMESPLDYVAGLSLTFEQANLDFCRQFARGFEAAGDQTTARLLEGIYRDEIAHVAYGLKWFRRWKDAKLTDWEAFRRQLKFPLSPGRAKGPSLNEEGRRLAGLDAGFIAELDVYSQSKGRTPGVFVFNPFEEERIARGKSFTPAKSQAALARDLTNLPQFLCRQDDVVLVSRRPSIEFLSRIKRSGFPLPEFVELQGDAIAAESSLRKRKLGRLRPWARGPGSSELLAPLFGNLNGGDASPETWFTREMARLYSKAWSAEFLRSVLGRWNSEWLCSSDEAGVAVSTPAEADREIQRIRQRGWHRIVIKEDLGIAGGNALRLWEPSMLPSQRGWIENACDQGRTLVVEPWFEREIDFSAQMEMDSRGLSLRGWTGLIADFKGRFEGNWAEPNYRKNVPAAVMERLGLGGRAREPMRALFEEIRGGLERELARAGYAGPVGIDAFVGRRPDGRSALKPVVEINPRYTMGRLTLELMNRVCPGSRATFRLVSRTAARAAGFEDFPALARHMEKRHPLRLVGEPIPRAREGALCLNDPAAAESCVAVLLVGPPAKEETRDSVLFK